MYSGDRVPPCILTIFICKIHIDKSIIFYLEKINCLLHKYIYCMQTDMNLVAYVSSPVKEKHILKTLKIHLETCLVQQEFVRSQKNIQKQSLV